MTKPCSGSVDHAAACGGGRHYHGRTCDYCLADDVLRSVRALIARLDPEEEEAMTTNAQHTPGPWTAHDDDGTGTLPCVLAKQPTAAGNFYVAQCNVFADARLIAAASELLAALRGLESALTTALRASHWSNQQKPVGVVEALHEARAAIRKATDAA